MFWNILAIENTKNLKRSLLWVELILLALLMISINLFFYTTLQSIPEGVTISAENRAQIPELVFWPGSLVFALSFVGGNGLGGLLLFVFVGAVTAQEYTWRTFRLWLSRGTPRPLLLAAKFTALLLPSLAVVLTALVSGAGISAILSTHINGTLHLDRVNFWQLGLSVFRTAYSLLPYAALTYLLAIAARSAVVAIGGSLAYTLIIEPFLVQALAISKSLAPLAKYLPATLGESLLRLNLAIAGLSGGTQPDLLGPVPAAAGMAIWTISLVTLALWIFRRQDFTG